jgi:hypothetical protein
MFVLIDNFIIEKMCNKVGFEAGDGLFCPGNNYKHYGNF